MATNSSARDIRAGGAYIEIKADTRKAIQSAKTVEERYKAMIESLKEDFDGMRDIFAHLSEGAKQIAKPIMEYEDAMKMLQATLSLTNKEMERFSRIANGMKSTYSPTKIVETMTELGRAGLNADQIEGTIKPTLQMAKMSGYDPTMISGMLTNTATIFKISPSEMATLADKLMMTANSANMNLQDLSEAMKYSAQTAQMSGLSLEQLLADLAGMANRGVRGSTAGTSYAQILRSLAKPETAKNLGATSDISELTKHYNELESMLRQLKVATTDANGNLRSPLDVIRDISTAQAGQGNANIVAAFQKLFGESGMLGAAALADAQKDSQMLLEKISNSQGYVDKGVQGVETSTSAILDKMRSQFETELNRLAETDNNSVNQSLNAFREAVVLLTNHMDSLTDVVAKLAPVIISYIVATKAGKMMGNVNGQMIAGAMVEGTKIAGKMLSMQLGGMLAEQLADKAGVDSELAKTGISIGGQAAGLLLAPFLLKAGTALAGAMASSALAPATIAAGAVYGYEYYKTRQNEKIGEQLEKAASDKWAVHLEMLKQYNDRLEKNFFGGVTGGYAELSEDLANALKGEQDSAKRMNIIQAYYNEVQKYANQYKANLEKLISDEKLKPEHAKELQKQLEALSAQELASMQEKVNIQKQIVDAEEKTRQAAQDFLDQLNKQQSTKNLTSELTEMFKIDDEIAKLKPTDSQLIGQLTAKKEEMMLAFQDKLLADVSNGIEKMRDAMAEDTTFQEKIRNATLAINEIEGLYDKVGMLTKDIREATAQGDAAKVSDLMGQYNAVTKQIDQKVGVVMEALNEQLDSVASHFGFGSFNVEDVIQRSLGLGGSNIEQQQLNELKHIRRRIDQLEVATYQ